MTRFELRTLATHKRTHLPHWDCENGIYALTFSLFDAVPSERVLKLQSEAEAQRERLRRTHGDTLIREERAIARWLQLEIDRLRDEGHGSSFMRRSDVADVVVAAILNQDDASCDLYSWCVMPNHVHLVARLREGCSIANLARRIKGASARAANRILGRERLPFWQEDYFDRTVRNAEELRRWISYVEANPAKAGLENWRWCETHRERLAGSLMT